MRTSVGKVKDTLKEMKKYVRKTKDPAVGKIKINQSGCYLWDGEIGVYSGLIQHEEPIQLELDWLEKELDGMGGDFVLKSPKKTDRAVEFPRIGDEGNLHVSEKQSEFFIDAFKYIYKNIKPPSWQAHSILVSRSGIIAGDSDRVFLFESDYRNGFVGTVSVPHRFAAVVNKWKNREARIVITKHDVYISGNRVAVFCKPEKYPDSAYSNLMDYVRSENNNSSLSPIEGMYNCFMVEDDSDRE